MIAQQEKRRDAVRALRDNWDAAAIEDAQHAVVTIPGQTEEEFFASGQVEVADALNRLEELGVHHGWELALDFGCGLGRCTTALASHFDKVVGIDVSGEMIARARRTRRVTYMRADSLDSLTRASYDLIYSNITLQHMPRWLQRPYIADFLTLIRRGGAVVFELPDFPDMGEVQHALAMGGAPPDEVERWIEGAGGVVAARDATGSTGSTSIPCYRYVVVRA